MAGRFGVVVADDADVVTAGEVVPTSQAADGNRPAPAGRPWVMLNMVASLDGSAAVGGRSQPLSGSADRELFHALRDRADAVLVGARTAVTERYRRLSHTLVIVSRSLGLDDVPAVTSDGAEGEASVVVWTPVDADEDAVAALGQRVDVWQVGDGGVDFAAALARLAQSGVRTVLCEGGPTINAELLRADLVDEVNLTIAPLVEGGAGPRIVEEGFAGATQGRDTLGFRTVRVMHDDGWLFIRWVRCHNQH